jgi:hypothetical protein
MSEEDPIVPSLLNHLSKEVVFLKKIVLVDNQRYADYFYEKLQKQTPERIKKVGIDKISNSYTLKELNVSPIEQSIQLLTTCLEKNDNGYTLDFYEYKLEDFKSDDSDNDKDYSEVVNTILTITTQYARLCNGGYKSQVNKITEWLKECLKLVAQINETYDKTKKWLNSLNYLKLDTSTSLRKLSKTLGGKRTRNKRRGRRRKLTRRNRHSRK